MLIPLERIWGVSQGQVVRTMLTTTIGYESVPFWDTILMNSVAMQVSLQIIDGSRLAVIWRASMSTRCIR